jgi:hypothetical protein
VVSLRKGVTGFVVASLAFLQTARAESFEYEPAVSTLTGVIRTEEHFGPPGYGESPRTDTRLKAFVLALDHPISVSARTGDGDTPNTTSFENIELIQLNIAPAPPTHRHVRVTGALFQAHTAHHYTDVLMDVHSVELLED